MFGIGGEFSPGIADVDEFRLGDSVTRHVRFLVGGESGMGEGIDMLLGLDVLRGFDIEFDLGQDAVRLFTAYGCEGQSLAYWSESPAQVVEFEALSGSRPRIAFPVRVNDIAVDAVLDSGAATSVLALRDAESAGVTPATPGVAAGPRLAGLGGKTAQSWVGVFRTFTIGEQTLRDVPIRFADLYRETAYVETGSRIPRRALQNQPMIIGADFLRANRTLIANSQRRLYFTHTAGLVFDTGGPASAQR